MTDNVTPKALKDEKQGIYFGWIVVAGVFFMVAASCGSIYSFGVFFVPILKEFGWSRSVVSGIVFCFGIAYAITIPLIGIAADRFGYKWISILTMGMMGAGFILGSFASSIWQMYLFIGLLPGIGACAAIPLPISLISHWFVKRQGLALGISSAGIGVGAAIMPLLIAYIETQAGWRMAMLTLGTLILLTYIPIALFVMKLPQKGYVEAYEGLTQVQTQKVTINRKPDTTLFQALKTKYFWSLFIIFGFTILCLGLILTHLVPYARDTGISPLTAASLLTIVGFFSIAGRLAAGFISDRCGAPKVLFWALLLQGIMMLWIPRIDSLGLFYTFALFFGVAYGANLVMIPTLTANIFGVKSMGAIYGSLSVADGIGFAFGPLLAGYLFDLSGNYNSAFIFSAAGLFFALALTFVFRRNP